MQNILPTPLFFSLRSRKTLFLISIMFLFFTFSVDITFLRPISHLLRPISPLLRPTPVHASFNELGDPVIWYRFSNELSATHSGSNQGESELILTLGDSKINGFGKYGHGLKLNGTTAYASASDSTQASQTGSFSVDAWIKLDSVSTTEDTIQTVLAKWDETTDIRMYRLIVQTDATGRAFPKFQISTDGTAATIQTVTATTQILPDKWYQLTGYFDATGAGTLYIYVNGVLNAQTATVGTSLTDTTAGFYLGATKTGASTYSHYLAGMIDEVRVFSGTRATGSLSQAYEEGRPAAYLPLNEGTGNGVYYEEKRLQQSHWGALVNFPTDDSHWVTGAASSYAIQFDGTDDYIDLGERDYLQLGAGITISARINPTDLAATYTVVSQPHANGYTFYITTAGEMVFGALGGTTATTTGAGITADTWQYVTVSYDGTTAYFFKDGRLISSPALELWSVTKGATAVGKAGDTPNYFKGKIDDVVIYPYSRTVFEIQVDKNQGLATFGSATMPLSLIHI